MPQLDQQRVAELVGLLDAQQAIITRILSEVSHLVQEAARSTESTPGLRKIERRVVHDRRKPQLPSA